MDCRCAADWVCESHPDRPWEHDGCGGAGVQCPNQDCPWWKGPMPAALNTDIGETVSVSRTTDRDAVAFIDAAC